MNCCQQCLGIEEVFNEGEADRELKRYHRDGPSQTTGMLIEALKGEAPEGVEGMTLLDIGGGIGAIQYALLHAGVTSATSVDASAAYVAAARREAERQGLADRITHRHGNFIELAADIPPADIVTLDRVICCFDDMERLVSLSAARARRLYGVVYPRDTWWIKAGVAVFNLFFKLQRNPFRSFVHPTAAVDQVVRSNGLQQRVYRRTWLWQMVVYAR